MDITAVTRIFPSADFLQPSDETPIRSIVLETEQATIVAWHVEVGQEIAAHVHPNGQDTWVVLSGCADYYQGEGKVVKLNAGHIAVAKPGQVHGAINADAKEPFIFISVVAPQNAGYELAEK
jgi:quercetin dioxygenase-like cupin family protein